MLSLKSYATHVTLEASVIKIIKKFDVEFIKLINKIKKPITCVCD